MRCHLITNNLLNHHLRPQSLSHSQSIVRAKRGQSKSCGLSSSVTLLTAEGGDPDKLTYHHKQPRQRIERQLCYEGLESNQIKRKKGTVCSLSSGSGRTILSCGKCARHFPLGSKEVLVSFPSVGSSFRVNDPSISSARRCGSERSRPHGRPVRRVPEPYGPTSGGCDLFPVPSG